MNTKTEPTPAAGDGSASQSPANKPRFAIFLATAGGLGYFPKAPGTLGSLAGLLIAILPFWITLITDIHFQGRMPSDFDFILVSQVFLTIIIAAVGVWSATRAADFWRIKDPQRVVIDEVSGQHLTLLLGCGVPVWWRATPPQNFDASFGLISLNSPLSWKYLLVGFILFRLFDIWKPSPARQAESLPGGWGIMADDWIAGVYAAIGLWLARAAGL
jgi:phosphatidylglycerophosphatase A